MRYGALCVRQGGELQLADLRGGEDMWRMAQDRAPGGASGRSKVVEDMWKLAQDRGLSTQSKVYAQSTEMGPFNRYWK